MSESKFDYQAYYTVSMDIIVVMHSPNIVYIS